MLYMCVCVCVRARAYYVYDLPGYPVVGLPGWSIKTKAHGNRKCEKNENEKRPHKTSHTLNTRSWSR